MTFAPLSCKYMSNKFISWAIFVILCFIWGSSFLLMLIGLEHLNPWQVAALRLFSGGIILLPFAWSSFKKIPKGKAFDVILSGLLGSFFPAFLFCLAETRLDSSFTGTLNSLTPIFVILVGSLFFKLKVNIRQVAGILISFTGSICLFLVKSGKTGDLVYIGFVVLATFFYGLNVNVVARRLYTVPSFDIAVLAFSFLTIPSLVILLAFNTQNLSVAEPGIIWSIMASAALGILGTTLASILFYVLLKKAGGVFASTVTYGIPFVAIFWGWIYNEKVTIPVILSLLVILAGIFITNSNQNPAKWLAGLPEKIRNKKGNIKPT